MKDTQQTPIYMDLGDFIPEAYTLRFKISDHAYEFQFAEASVDEVLTLMALQAEKEDFIEKDRRALLSFLSHHMTRGSPEHLEKDLAAVPYSSKRDSLDIMKILGAVNARFKKKDDMGHPG